MSNSALTMVPRVGSMMRLDFYRLFHTPALYTMLLISAVIPAMVLTMSGSGTDVNAWQVVESAGGAMASASTVEQVGTANINMVFIFAGLLLSIFVSHDYTSGFVKSIFTVHSKKMDYVISKTAVGIFGGVALIAAYLIGTVVAGAIMGASFEADVAGLIFCVLSKIFLMGVFGSLFLAISVFFRTRLWLTIVFTFLLGMMLYPTASVATLDSTVITTLATLVAGAVGALALGSLSTLILSRRDLT